MKSLVLFVALLVSLAAGEGNVGATGNIGTTENAEIVLGSSAFYTEAEMQEAVDVVKETFRGFQGCEMRKIVYAPEKSSKEAESEGVDPENAIVFLTEFDVGAGADACWDEGEEVTDWNFVLIRESADSPWVVVNWGY